MMQMLHQGCSLKASLHEVLHINSLYEYLLKEGKVGVS